jgi:hypothetical protein
MKAAGKIPAAFVLCQVVFGMQVDQTVGETLHSGSYFGETRE